MQYYVIGPDGNKYGPADVPTLKQWVVENRLSPDSMLEDFGTGQRMPASSVAGLFGDQPTMAAAPQPGPSMGAPTAAPTGTVYSQVPQMGRPQAAGDDGKIFIILGWIFSSFGIVLCCPYVSQFSAIIGTVFAFLAGSKGHPGAKALKIYSIIMLVISLTALILMFVFAQSIQDWAQEMQRQQGR